MEFQNPQTTPNGQPPQPQGENRCPSCGGRIVKGAMFCMHCNAELPPEITGDKDRKEQTQMTLLMTVIVGVGVAIAVLLAVKVYFTDPVSEPVTFDGTNSVSTHCVEESNTENVDELLRKGYSELESAPPGMRCFRLIE